MNNMKRMRGRSHRNPSSGGGGGGAPRNYSGQIPLNRNHVFDSNGPDLRVRGTAQQLFEKYLQLGRDATSSGDRVMAEGYFQHAEHYFRIVNAMNQAAQAQALTQPEQMQQGDRTSEIRDARDVRDTRDIRDPRDQRDTRDIREPRSDQRDIREAREPREQREPRGERQHYNNRERGERQERYQNRPRETVETIAEEQPAGFGDQPPIEAREIPIAVTPPDAS
jgi:hypothetical protein